MASFQVGANCYPDALAAAWASASSQVGLVVPLGSSLYVVGVESVAETAITYRLDALDSTASIVKVVPYTPAPCGLMDTTEGLLLGWAVAAVWLVTASITHLRSAVHE